MWGPADAGAIADAAALDATVADAQVGPTCLPNPLSGTWTGDAHATAACGPFVFQTVNITGNLKVDPGVEIRLEGRAHVAGALQVGAGARLLCVFGPATYGDYLVVGTTSEIQGTAATSRARRSPASTMAVPFAWESRMSTTRSSPRPR